MHANTYMDEYAPKHTYIHTHTHSLSLALLLSRSLALVLSLARSRSLSLTLSLTLALSHAHTQVQQQLLHQAIEIETMGKSKREHILLETEDQATQTPSHTGSICTNLHVCVCNIHVCVYVCTFVCVYE